MGRRWVRRKKQKTEQAHNSLVAGYGSSDDDEDGSDGEAAPASPWEKHVDAATGKEWILEVNGTSSGLAPGAEADDNADIRELVLAKMSAKLCAPAEAAPAEEAAAPPAAAPPEA